MKTNPREQNLSIKVSKTICESINIRDKTFPIKRRGIVLSAKSVSYDQKAEKLTIVIDDEEAHGNIDGGHSYKRILEERNRIKKNNMSK